MCCQTFIMSKVHSASPGLGCMTFHLSAVYSAPYVFKFSLKNFRYIINGQGRQHQIQEIDPCNNLSDTSSSEILNLKARP